MVFVRLANCNLRCTWCDTRYAYWDAKLQSVPQILDQVKGHPTKWVCVTGGEPLGQKGTIELLNELVRNQYKVSLETNGSFCIQTVPSEVVRILDVKCPSSGESDSMKLENLNFLNSHDEVKFVIGNKEDFDWAMEVDLKFNISGKCQVLFSPVFGKVVSSDLAMWILDAKAPVRMQTQMHKEIWAENQRGV